MSPWMRKRAYDAMIDCRGKIAGGGVYAVMM
jgi:hypothetical protein